MRVAVLTDGHPPWDEGGTQKIAARLAEGYAERDHEVLVVTGVTDRDEVGRATANGVAVRTLWAPKPRRSCRTSLSTTPSWWDRSAGRSTRSTTTPARWPTANSPATSSAVNPTRAPSRPRSTASAPGDSSAGRGGDTTRFATAGTDKLHLAISNAAWR